MDNDRLAVLDEQCNHIFQYPFIDCKRCGKRLHVGDYTVAQIMGDWSIQHVDRLDDKLT